jgi:Domain of unknown function (DUF3943)
VTDGGRGARGPLPRGLVAAGLIALVLNTAARPVLAEDQPSFLSAFDPASLDPAALAEPSDHDNPRLTKPGQELFATGDWLGLTRDTGLLLTYQLIGVAIFYVAPESVSQWDESAKDNVGFERWWFNVTHPTWDDDAWWVNAGHAYFGAAYYIRARERGFGEFNAFLYSVLASTIYEFGIEAFFEPPSYNDLILTPVGGALIGAFVFEPIRRAIRAKPELKWYDHTLLVLSDPLGGANYLVERLFGIKSEIRVNTRPPAHVQVGPPRYRIGRSGGGGESPPQSGVSIELRMLW